MRRPRGPGGRFLTADEVAAIESGKGAEVGLEGYDKATLDAQIKGESTPKPRSAGQKRKAGVVSSEIQMPVLKKSKNEPPRRSTSAEESEEPDDEDDGDDDG